MDDSSMMVKGLDTTNNRISTDGQGTHLSIGPQGAPPGFMDMNLNIEEMWASKSILYQIKEEEERDAISQGRDHDRSMKHRTDNAHVFTNYHNKSTHEHGHGGKQLTENSGIEDGDMQFGDDFKGSLVEAIG